MTNLTQLIKANMTNTTTNTNEETTMTTTTTNNELGFVAETAPTTVAKAIQTSFEPIDLQDINKSALVSTMAAELFHQELSPTMSMVVATAFVGAMEYIDEDYEDFMEYLVDGITETRVKVEYKTHLTNDQKEAVDNCNADANGERNLGVIFKALQGANYLGENEVGPRMMELCELRQEAYRPVEASIGITDENRRFGYAKTEVGDLFKEFIHALESTEYTRDDFMLGLALQVQAKTGGADNDAEGYVIKGCNAMASNKAYVSEFKGDTRLRGYQACCHGPNGQSSDRSRALMDLVGVPTNYDVPTVKKHIMAEIADMTGDIKGAIESLKELGEVDFIIANLDKDTAIVKKPWSFVKAARIMRELQAGNRPYIGMAVGLDAKCSGPQLGALMVGDQQIAAACGMTLVQLEDAYMLALKDLAREGFTGITRNGIKKAYMGVFYGQGWMAFTDTNEIGTELANSLYGTGAVSDDIAKKFHKVLTKSFGNKMVSVRKMFREYGAITTGRTTHKMPDGSVVAMNYKQKVNVLGEAMDFDTETFDIRLQNNAETFKFINVQLKTREVHVGDFARNGFVNMIQATDALIARLIVVHLKRLGAKHIISVHDCFRVNVTEMHLLEQAIKNAYMDLFGSEQNTFSKDMPCGQDILGMYFQGANNQLVEGAEPMMVSQFLASGKRRMRKVNGVSLPELINALGTSYYFAK